MSADIFNELRRTRTLIVGMTAAEFGPNVEQLRAVVGTVRRVDSHAEIDLEEWDLGRHR